MSYILDALRKSDQERQRGTVPDPLTVQQPIVKARRKRTSGRYAAAPLALIALGLGVWWSVVHFTGGPGPQPAQEMKTTVPSAGEDRLVEAGHGARESAEAPLPSAGPSALRSAPPSRTVNPLMRGQAKSPVVKEPPSGETVKHELPQAATQAVQPAVKEVHAADQTPPIPPADPGRLYRVGDLPAPLRKGLPPVTLTAFMYSTNPASRMVRINDRMMKEGQDLAEGVRLLEITPDGVILVSKGYRFFVAMK